MSQTRNASTALNRRRLLAGAAAVTTVIAAPAIVRAQGGALKVGVLLPRSGAQAGIGQDCFRGVELANPIFKGIGLPELEIMSADTETNVEVARSRAEKLIADGAQLLMGAFDSGQSSAIAQVAEQKGIPLRHQHRRRAADHRAGLQVRVPQLPDRGNDSQRRLRQPEGSLCRESGKEPKSVVFLHVNDTFGTAMKNGVGAMMPKFNMPYEIKETISYDPTARDLSVEVSKAKATGADALLVVSRLNDAILLTRELVKQRWSPMGILSMGPGWYEDQYLKTLAKLGDGPLSFVPWYDPNKKLSKQLEAALAKKYPGVNMNTNHIYTFEALLVAADAYKRAKSADPKALADAIRATNITDNVSTGPGISFNEKGQNVKLKNSAIQNRGGKLVTVAPKGATNAKAEWPMTAYDKRR